MEESPTTAHQSFRFDGLSPLPLGLDFAPTAPRLVSAHFGRLWQTEHMVNAKPLRVVCDAGRIQHALEQVSLA